MLHLVRRAFQPAPPPFPALHVDTTLQLQERYRLCEQKARGINPVDHGSQVHTDLWKTQGLKQALTHHGFDAAFGDVRRDEEKSRAKERIFSFRNDQHRGDPKNQRPELWHMYNGRKCAGESIRVSPLSN